MHVFARIGRHEFRTLDAIMTRVVAGVSHGIGALFDADHARRSRIAVDAACSHEPNSASAAVRIHEHFDARELRHFDRATIKHLGLRGVHLVKRLRGNAEAQPA